ncbi:MAG: hypothetical protein PHQ42_03105 [Patescibacteria group bacterium]|nr:hypothetical protein [Patescibacteria group bacterium]
MRSFVIFIFAIVLAAFAFGCGGKPQFRSNVHSGDVPEWVVPAAFNPAFKKDGKIIAVGLAAGRMFDRMGQAEEAVQIAVSKIKKHYGQETKAIVTNMFVDQYGNIFAIATKQ